MEIDKLKMSLARHVQHTEDAGSVLRQQAISEIKQQLEEVEERRRQHKQEADEEHEYYKSRVTGAHDNYLRMCSLFYRYAAADANISLANLIADLSEATFELASDYQQDKAYPHWGESPQPGETYFMSKVARLLDRIRRCLIEFRPC